MKNLILYPLVNVGYLILEIKVGGCSGLNSVE